MQEPEGDETTVVVVVVGKGDQGFVATSIVPLETIGLDARDEDYVKNRRQIALDLFEILVIVICTAKKFVGGNCLGSPAMIVWPPRAIAPIASQVVI